MPELKLPFRWTLWEQYEIKDSKDYRKTMTKVACFEDLLSFWKIWNNVPHRDPANFFAFTDEDGTTKNKFYPINDREVKINTLSLFITGIDPEWEDPINAKGGQFSL